MAYLTPEDLLLDGALRLAHLAGPEDGPTLDADTLRLQLAGEDLTELGLDVPVIDAATRAQTNIENAIGRAESALEGAVRERYALPLNPVDDLVLGIVRDLAWFYLYRNGATDDATKRAELARADLARIQRGETVLTAARLQTDIGPGAGMPDYAVADPVFSSAVLDDFTG